MRLITAVQVIAALLCAAHTAAACNVSYCNYRGNGTGTDPDCGCSCVLPYYAGQCLGVTPGNWSQVDCGDSFNSQSKGYCEAPGPCYWNDTTATCEEKVTKNNEVPPPEANVLKGCPGGFPLLLKMLVFALATFCFGFCLFSLFYLIYWNDVYSRVDNTGVRMYNQFFGRASIVLMIYFAIVVVAAIILAITAWINFMWPDNCAYVGFCYIFLLVLLAPLILFAAYYGGRWVYRRCTEGKKPPLEVDDHVRPRKAQWRNKNSCQSRLF